MEEIYCFGGNPLDRVSEKRADTAWVEALLDDPRTQVLLLDELKPVVHRAPELALAWQPVRPWRGLFEGGATWLLLGIDADERAYFAVDATSAEIPAGGDTSTLDARTVAASVAGGEAAILAEARSLIDWHARHGFCAACGAPSRIASAGWTRRCPNCNAQHFPRVDPVVIMLAVRGERCLLGRNARRGVSNRFSCLAGFMEPGETLEEAVRREIHEESGIEVGRVKYLASQPWPFPSSLMMGFLAEAVSDEITIDAEEIAEARWFDREEAKAMVERAVAGIDDPALPVLPAPIAIGHHICRRWAFGLDGI
jgi:NAD+ diphosphatase